MNLGAKGLANELHCNIYCVRCYNTTADFSWNSHFVYNNFHCIFVPTIGQIKFSSSRINSVILLGQIQEEYIKDKDVNICLH